jgi:hypothetical protein
MPYNKTQKAILTCARMRRLDYEIPFSQYDNNDIFDVITAVSYHPFLNYHFDTLGEQAAEEQPYLKKFVVNWAGRAVEKTSPRRTILPICQRES